MTREQEKQNERKALFISLGIHAAVFLVLFFMVAWRAPNPPLPEYGIELNFGMDNQGTGSVQPKTPVGSQGTQQQEPEQPKPVEEKPQEEAAQPVIAESKPVPQEVVSKIESPVKVEEKKKEDPKPEVKNPEKPVEKVVEPKKEEVKPKEETKPKVDDNSVYKPKTQNTESANKTNEGKEGQPGSHGDDKGKTGDKGNPEGSLDAKALYGQQGGGGGSSLDLAGWVWDEIPRPNVPNNASGRIVFEIVVNADGELERYQIIENSLSPEAAKACREAVEKLTFTKTGTNVPSLSKGRITFVVRSK
jgi:periplasmic protein TonB